MNLFQVSASIPNLSHMSLWGDKQSFLWGSLQKHSAQPKVSAVPSLPTAVNQKFLSRIQISTRKSWPVMWELENLHLFCRVHWEITCSCVGNSGVLSLLLLSQCFPNSFFFFFWCPNMLLFLCFILGWQKQFRNVAEHAGCVQMQGAPGRSWFWDPWHSHFLLKCGGFFWPLTPALLSRWQSESLLGFQQALAFGSLQWKIIA